jgi:glycine dehydrogenase subunit 1
MADYILNTEQQEKDMLERTGFVSLEDLYQDLPKELLLKRELSLPLGQSEFTVLDSLKHLSQQNTHYRVILRGAGVEDHFIPSVVKKMAARDEFVTAYTPYQSEFSQGILQSIFEFQTSICELTGMDVGNASVYDGPTASAEAIQMVLERKRNQILIPEHLAPQITAVMKTYTQWLDIEFVTIKSNQGCFDLEDLKAKLSDQSAGVWVQYPNYFGILEPLEEISLLTHQAGAKVVVYTNPMALGALKSPRSLGADIAIGEAQVLGIPMSFGGPFLGFMAASQELVRRLPGRIAGQTVDGEGNRAFTLTLQAREQHIRREKATSSICSNQALMALTASIYLAALGPKGLQEVAQACHSKAHYLASGLSSIGFKLKYDQPFFHEFVTVSSVDHTTIERTLHDLGILAGLKLSSHETLWCVTETTKKADLDRVIHALKEVMP